KGNLQWQLHRDSPRHVSQHAVPYAAGMGASAVLEPRGMHLGRPQRANLMRQGDHNVLDFARRNLFGDHLEPSTDDTFRVDFWVVRESSPDVGKELDFPPLFDGLVAGMPAFEVKSADQHWQLSA